MENSISYIYGQAAGISIVFFIALYILGLFITIPVAIVVAYNRKKGRYRIRSTQPGTPAKYTVKKSLPNNINKPISKLRIPEIITQCKQEAYKINPYYRNINNQMVKNKIMDITHKYETLINIAYTQPALRENILEFIKETVASCETILGFAKNSSLGNFANSSSHSKSEESILKALNLIIKKINIKIDNIHSSDTDAIQAEIKALEDSIAIKELVKN